MDDKCYLLYSVKDALEFLSFENKDRCRIFSKVIDAQKVFIVRFENSEVSSRFEEHVEKPDYTMLGCVSSSESVNLQDETLLTLGEYINGLGR